MNDPSTGAPPAPPELPADERLDSWKEIAAYLKRDVTTVQRWEKREAMPVRRHLHDKQGSVYAFRSELDAWTRGRNPRPAQEAVSSAAPEPPPRRRRLAAIVAASIAGATALGILGVRSRPHDAPSRISRAQFRNVTDFEGMEHAAAVSRDGRFVAFLSDHDGPTDVWVTQIGTGQFYNLTKGAFPELVNPSVRTMGFSPDGALVTFWVRKTAGSGAADLAIWSIPTLGGQPRPYLEGVAELDWSSDGARLVYHTPGPGDPTYVRAPGQEKDRLILTAETGLHAHFPLWSSDQSFIYFVQGHVPDGMDIWRVAASGGPPERITRHNARVSHPVIVDDRTLAYLAADADGAGPWVYTVDTGTRVSKRVIAGVDRYTSLAASADGRRLVATIANPKVSLWRMRMDAAALDPAAPVLIPLTTGSGFAPRLGPGYILYVSSRGASDSIWKLADGRTTELWTAPDARVLGSPEIGPDGRIAFSAALDGHTILYVMNGDGTDARLVTASLDLHGGPAWAPRGASVTSAVNVEGGPRLFDIALDGTATPLARDYSVDPVWAPTGDYVVYAGPQVGTTFPLHGMRADRGAQALPPLTLTRGARRPRFVDGGKALVVLRGDLQHKDLWRIDLATGQERRLTQLPVDFAVRDFDISRDGRDIVLERLQDRSDVVMLETPAR